MPEIPLRVIMPADVRASIGRARRSLETAAAEIALQVEREAWVTLGYRSWGAMREAEYGDTAFMVPNKDRPELAGLVPQVSPAGLAARIEHMRGAEVEARTERLRLEALQAGDDRACPVCGAAIVGRSDRRFCSPACRQRAHRQRTT